jgi:signal transduction histidine kinase
MQAESGTTLVEAQETERARIARELHDGVGQQLALLRINLDELAGAQPSAEQRTLIEGISGQLDEVARELHDIAYRLHPLRLELLGLAKSITALCQETSRQSGVAVTVSCAGDLPNRISAEASLCLYRIAQEALQNVVRHSAAGHARVEVECRDAAIRLQVVDDGQGFDASFATGGLGRPDEHAPARRAAQRDPHHRFAAGARDPHFGQHSRATAGR